ncbi:MAG TPA: hypothetical protein PLE61_15770 [Vicinamibacterales bacterium]|nr:hypothetical protein [Thermoanaerobaculia bacterium]HPW22258.1 hypothetical protein [Vicinamibacterales bacterium]
MKRVYRVQAAAMTVSTCYVVAESEAEAAEQVRECPLGQLLPEATIQGAIDQVEVTPATWEQAAKDGWLTNSPFVFDAFRKELFYFALDDDTVEDWLIAIEEAQAAELPEVELEATA